MPPLPSSSSDASLVTHEIQDRLLTKFRYLTDFLDLGLQCAACRWLFVEKDNVIRMLGEFWPDIFVILLVCSLVSFANQKRSEEHTSELQSLMRISYAVFCLIQKITPQTTQ